MLVCSKCNGKFRTLKLEDDLACPTCSSKKTLTVMQGALRINEQNEDDKKTMKVNHLRHLMSNLIRREKLDGKDCLVCPTVLICEGVHNNVYYPAEQLATFPDSWNGRPVVIDHPELMGNPVTANSPELLEKQTVGQVFNTVWDEKAKKLRGEVWILIEKCETICPDIMQRLQDNQNVEVSTGLFTECDGVSGEWNSEKYIGTVFNYRPDHLALLPDDVGACSWEDGGGMPRNNTADPTNNELSHDQIWMALSDAITAKFDSGGVNDINSAWVRTVYDKDFIYHKRDGEGGSLFRQAYSVDASDQVELVGDPVEVVEETSFVPVTNKEDENTEGVHNMDRVKLVDALIANKKSEWAEEDRELLTNMSDAQFEKVTKEPEVEEPKVEPKVEEPVADPKVEEPTENKDPKTIEELTSNMDDSPLKRSIARAMARDEEIKTNMVKELIANDSCPFTEEQLKGKEIEELQQLIQLSGSQKKAIDFSAAAPAVNTASDDIGGEVPDMPELFANARETYKNKKASA